MGALWGFSRAYGGSMGSYGVLWGIYGGYGGNIWGDMGSYGGIWGSNMGIRGGYGGFMGDMGRYYGCSYRMGEFHLWVPLPPKPPFPSHTTIYPP